MRNFLCLCFILTGFFASASPQAGFYTDGWLNPCGIKVKGNIASGSTLTVTAFKHQGLWLLAQTVEKTKNLICEQFIHGTVNFTCSQDSSKVQCVHQFTKRGKDGENLLIRDVMTLADEKTIAFERYFPGYNDGKPSFYFNFYKFNPALLESTVIFDYWTHNNYIENRSQYPSAD